jgi:hypothetical protein
MVNASHAAHRLKAKAEVLTPNQELTNPTTDFGFGTRKGLFPKGGSLMGANPSFQIEDLDVLTGPGLRHGHRGNPPGARKLESF